ncbi:MAG: hypothetical protein WC866_00565 [Patescibacteria group bacterium]|jgi:hypothetical protein
MKLLEGHDLHEDLPRERIKINADLVLPDSVRCRLGLKTNEDPNAPYLTVKLGFYRTGDAVYEHDFRDPPPTMYLDQVGVSGLVLFNCAGADCEDALHELIDLTGNRAFTPLADIQIDQDHHWVIISLAIGKKGDRYYWEAAHNVKLADFKQSLHL